MSLQELNVDEIEQVSGGVTAGQVLNVGAGITATGAAVLAGTAALAGAPIFTAAVAAYGLASAVMWTAGAFSDIGMMNIGGGIGRDYHKPVATR